MSTLSRIVMARIMFERNHGKRPNAVYIGSTILAKLRMECEGVWDTERMYDTVDCMRLYIVHDAPLHIGVGVVTAP